MAVQTSVDVSDFARLNTLNIELADRELSTTPSDAQRPFRFDALPPELRLEIVEYIIIRPTTISWQGSYSGDKKPRFETGFKYVCNGTNAYLPERYNVAAILITSRAVYSEVAPVFYRKNNFRFRSRRCIPRRKPSEISSHVLLTTIFPQQPQAFPSPSLTHYSRRTFTISRSVFHSPV